MVNKTLLGRLAELERRASQGDKKKTLDDFYKDLEAGTSGIEAFYPEHTDSPTTACNHDKPV